jgi:RNA polymerase sigma-70 factor (ECF subfamily)
MEGPDRSGSWAAAHRGRSTDRGAAEYVSPLERIPEGPAGFHVPREGPVRTTIETRTEPTDPRERGAPTTAPRAIDERDPDFLARLVARDREAMGHFYELYFERIHGFVRRMVGDDVLAEDVTQDVFLHLQRAIPTFDRARELAPWVFTIATNKVRDLWRSQRSAAGARGGGLDDDGAAAPEVADARPGPLPELEADELRAALPAAVDALPAGLRAAFVLRWQEGLEFDEIGRILERNEGAARKRYSRALAELRRALEASTHGSRRHA